MERPKPAEHFFGTSEDSKVLPHVGKALNLPALTAGDFKPEPGPRPCYRSAPGEAVVLAGIVSDNRTIALEEQQHLRNNCKTDVTAALMGIFGLIPMSEH